MRVSLPWRVGSAIVLALLVIGCAGRSPASDPGVSAAAEGAAPAAPSEGGEVPDAEPIETRSLLDPPDGVWLKDEQGREYWVYEVPRYEGHYRWENEEHTRVRLREMPPMDLISHDDRVFRLKMYRLAEPPRSGKAGPDPLDLKQAAATYRFDGASEDRLQLTAADRGLPRGGQWRNGFDVADLDGDGRLDIVHGPERKRPGAHASMFRQAGGGRWERLTVELPLALDYGDVAVADFDGDGAADLAAGCHLLGITAFRRTATAFEPFAEGLELAVQGAALATPVFSTRTIAAGDWDGDGRPDLVALGEGPRLATSPDVPDPSAFVAGSEGVRIYLQRGGRWELADVPSLKVYGDSLELVDLDGDGHLDALFGSSVPGNRGLLLRGRGEGEPEVIQLLGLRPGSMTRAIVPADFNGDGRLDLAVSYTSRELGVWRAGIDLLLQSPGMHFERRPVWSHEGREREVFAMAAGDVDGDGRSDLVAFDENGVGMLFLGAPGGRLIAEVEPELVQGDGCRGYDVAVVDLDGDGRDEIIAAFAGEPAKIPLAVSLAPTCKSGGGLRVWSASKAGS